MNDNINDVKVHEIVGEEQTEIIHHYQKDNSGNWFEVFGERAKKRVSKSMVYTLISNSVSSEQFIECSNEVSTFL